jgi:3-dehydroquinate synthase
MKRVRVNVPAGAYDVLVGQGALSPRNLRSVLGKNSHGVLMSSRKVMDLHGATIRAALSEAGFELRTEVRLPDGERAKTFREWDRASRALARAQIDRSGFVIAFGGGSVGDAAGFVAATYMRGIRVIQIPTTLLSMVDSSVGGKTGLNLKDGKNLVGAFHQPRLVLADLRFLSTLPARERQSGVYEILKCAFLKSVPLLRLIERTRGLRRASVPDLEKAVAMAVEVKARIVEADERESGERVFLNLGHTLGHALEAATGYRQYTHGEAVGYGMQFAVELGVQEGISSRTEASKMLAAIRQVGPRRALSGATAPRVRAATLRDKKRSGATIKEILLRAPAQPVIQEFDAPSFAKAAVDWLARQTRSAGSTAGY